MRNLAEHQKNLQEEILILLDRLNTLRSKIDPADDTVLASLQNNLSELQHKTAALRFLNSLPEEVEQIIVPFIPAAQNTIPVVPVIPEVPKKEEPFIIPKEKPAEPVIVPEIPVVPEIPKKEEPLVVPVVPKKEEPVIVPQEKIAEPAKIPVPEKPVQSAPAAKKYADIRSFIGFNERIMFMRNLFKNDGAAYDEALNQINSCNSFNEADTFLSVLKNEYSWDTGKEAVQIFIDTVKRRFA